MGKNAQRRRAAKMLDRPAGQVGTPNGLNRQTRRYLARKGKK